MRKRIRSISCNELLYSDMQYSTNSYAIQFIFKIEKIGNLKEIEKTINNVIKNNIGSNVYLKNNSYYMQDKLVKINNLEVNEEDFYNSDFFREKIDIKKESLKVYYVINKNDNNKYLIFKFLHSVMDGKGCLLFVQNVMNDLKGCELIKCNNFITDKEFIKKKDYYKKSEPKFPMIVNKNSNVIRDYKQRWRIIEIDGYIPAIVAKLSCLLANEFENDTVRMMIPTDIRRYEKNNNYIGNLTLPIFLNVNKKDSYDKVNGDLLYSLKNKMELNIANTSYFGYQYIPKTIRNIFLKLGSNLTQRYNKFSVGALISHLGRINLDEYNNDEVSFTDFVSLPIHQPLGAFSLVILEHSNITKIALTYYENKFSEEYIDYIVNKISSSLNKNIYSFNNTNLMFKENYLEKIEHNLKIQGNSIAVIDEDNTYSYNDLLTNINKFNRLIYDNNIKDKVILYLNRNFNYISAALSCIFNNITFIPIDKATNTERINKIIKESKSDYIISDENIDLGIKVITINNLNILKEKKVKLNYNSDHEVYHIYTSGTTGIPKCVPITNSNLNNYLLWCFDEYQVKRKMVMPLFTSLSVDLTITSTFLPLITAGTIKTFPESFNSNVLKKIVEDKDINVIKCTPTHLSFLLNFKEKFTSKEIFIIGGENLSVELCRKVSDLFNEARLYNEYGPTETTVATIFYLYDSKEDKDSIPIGKPIYNTKVLLYDNKIVKDLNQTGEIIISGDSVFKGYSNIKKDCFIDISGEKYYRTGDLGYIKDGNIYCLGRIDNQVKIYGNRVELDEISNEINKIDAVKDSTILYDDELYAFVIKNRNITVKEIKKHLELLLPSYMIPSKIIFLEEFPIKANGKIDSSKLLTNVEKKDKKVLKYNDKIIEILSSVKSIDSVSKDKTLFNLGLESFDVIVFIQKLIDYYIDSEDEEEFTYAILKNLGTITLKEIEKIIIEYGGILQ